MSDALPGDIASRLRFDSAGLIPAVIVEADGGEVLMVGYMDAVALARTLGTGRVWFYSRSRREYWRKGDTSGHVQLVRRVRIDCDGDCLLVEAAQVGSACHTGARSCFDAGGDLPVGSLIDRWPAEDDHENAEES
ncbi:MAG: phosphoribosyl-AMP cyclohydrolase [Actinomycetaceae bacterium]|nr:phosphoribosyl-AMP cyclohydrolase [Actinomycetaceae bacterium]